MATQLRQFNIVELANQWHVSGDVLIDNVNLILNQSDDFKLAGELVVDFADVGRMDTAALSLMLEWQRRAAAAHCTMHFKNVPENLSSLASLYGVKDFIAFSAQ